MTQSLTDIPNPLISWRTEPCCSGHFTYWLQWQQLWYCISWLKVFCKSVFIICFIMCSHGGYPDVVFVRKCSYMYLYLSVSRSLFYTGHQLTYLNNPQNTQRILVISSRGADLFISLVVNTILKNSSLICQRPALCWEKTGQSLRKTHDQPDVAVRLSHVPLH